MMKRMKAVLVFLFLVSGSALAADPVFTTVAYDNDQLYTGVKLRDPEKPIASIAVIDAKSGTHENISLPDEISKRDIIGIIPESDRIFVLTQDTSKAPGDAPLLYVFHKGKAQWKKLSSVDCPVFSNAKLMPKAMVSAAKRV